jgi:hypothetical protein
MPVGCRIAGSRRWMSTAMALILLPEAFLPGLI